jgi:S1-C subfamily serine protease
MNLRAQEVRDGRRGVRVQNVVPGTPADRFGLRPEDVITAVAGKPIDGSDGLMLEVGRMPADTQVRFAVLRGSERLEIPVTLAKYPVQGVKIVTAPSPAWRGMRVEYPTAVVDAPWAGQTRPTHFDEGVLAIEVVEGSPAWKAGLRPGTIIVRVDQTRVSTPRQFHAAVASRKGRVPLDVFAPGAESASTRVVEPGK